MTLTNLGEEVRIGVELEYPKMFGDEKFKKFGKFTNASTGIPQDDWASSGEITYELIGNQTYGTEIRTPNGGLPIDEVEDWYRGVLNEFAEKTGKRMEPVGLMSGTTAGLHTHISPLSREQAQTLCDFSKEPWMWVFACSTLAEGHALNEDQPVATVLRSKLAEEAPYSNYCRMKYGGSHSFVVNRRFDDHHEWRLPEPMTTEHFEILMEFIRRFIEDPDRAENFARSLVSSGDERLTSIRRAKEIGVENLESGITSVAFDSIRDILDTTDAEAEEALAD